MSRMSVFLTPTFQRLRKDKVIFRVTYRIMLPMARGLPQLCVVDVWGDNLLESSLPILASDKLNQFVVDVSSSRQEET